MIPLAAPYIAGREAEYVAQALAAGEVGAGSFVTRFEDAVRDFTGARYAVAMSSGTAALHIALLLAGVRPGDEVIVPATTFIATARAVQFCGATPVVVDVDRETWGLDFGQALEMARSGRERPASLLAVHIYGHPSWFVGGFDYGCPSIFDGSESLGATTEGYGNVGQGGFVALSFNANKLITTGGGGMLLTDDKAHASRARYLINQAKWSNDPTLYGSGFNYRMPNVNAAIGCAQMEDIAFRLASKRETHDHYAAELPGVFHEAQWARSSYWLSCMLVPSGVDKAAMMRALSAKGIETRSVWRPLHLQPGLEGCAAGRIEVAIDLYQRGVCLPSSVGITHEERVRVIEAVRECLG